MYLNGWIWVLTILFSPLHMNKKTARPTSSEGWRAEALSTQASREPHKTSNPQHTMTPLPPLPFPIATARCAVPGRASSPSLLPNLYAGEFMIHPQWWHCYLRELLGINMHAFSWLSPVLPSFRMRWFGLALFFIAKIMNSQTKGCWSKDGFKCERC